MQVAFCGGGSGGHLFPAVAVAQEWRRRDAAVRFTFLTSRREIDTRVLASANLPSEAYSHQALPVSTSAGRIRYAINVGRSFLQCRSHFRRCPPAVAIGLGGFASVPGILAAHSLHIPIVLLEPNTIPGAANRFLNRFAATTCMGWRMNDRYQQQWKSQLCHTGVPVRDEFFHTSRVPNHMDPPAPSTLLILGGSQGATAVNALAVAAIGQLNKDLSGWRIVHQTGKNAAAGVNALYEQQAISADTVEFLDDVPQWLTNADIVVSRCGAVTLAEIAALGRASVLIPLSTAADNHQAANAALFADAGAAWVVPEDSPDAVTILAQHLAALCQCADTRHQMAQQAQNLATSNAAQTIVDLLQRL